MSQQRFDGQLTWVGRSKNERTTSDVERAVMNNGALAFDVTTVMGRYTVKLQGTIGGTFTGQWRSGQRQGACSARVFDSDGGLFLFGEWIEDEEYDWWADLDPIETDG